MADERLAFQVEVIPDHSSVFMRAHRDRVKNGVARPSAFEPHGDGLSVDWDRYSTADATLSRTTNNPANSAVVQMGVGPIRAIRDGLDVIHDPLPNNQAHSLVNLPEDRVEETAVRLKLSQLATIVIHASAIP